MEWVSEEKGTTRKYFNVASLNTFLVHVVFIPALLFDPLVLHCDITTERKKAALPFFVVLLVSWAALVRRHALCRRRLQIFHHDFAIDFTRRSTA